MHYVSREVCEVGLPPRFSLFYLAFTEREQVTTLAQRIFDMCNEGYPLAGDSGEVNYLVIHGALQRGGFALFSSTVYLNT